MWGGGSRTPAEEQCSSATAESEELKQDFLIHSKNKGRDSRGTFTHRFHPVHLPLQAGNKFFKPNVIHRAVPVTKGRPAPMLTNRSENRRSIREARAKARAMSEALDVGHSLSRQSGTYF